MGSALKKIPLEELKLGMIIVRSDRPGVAFDEFGIPLTNLAKISKLKASGVKEVFIWEAVEDKITITKPEPVTVKTPTVEPASVKTPTEKPTIPKPQAKPIIQPKPKLKPETIDQGIDDIASNVIVVTELLQRSKRAIFESFDDIKKGKKLNVKYLTDVVAEIAMASTESPGIFTSIARLEEMGEEEYLHGMNVAIISLSIGQVMNISGRELINLGMAGLLHDIGKSRVPEKVLHRKTKLNEQEFHILRKHPEWGELILTRSGEISKDISLAVMRHHERADGSGYPAGLTAQYISPIATIIGMAEDYDTMTGGGAESYPVLHNSEAIRRIYTGIGNKFTEEYVKAFIKTMGVFPVGSLVRLSNDLVAIVCELNRNDPLRPKVISLGVNGMATPIFMNLAGIAGLKIDAPISASDYYINPQKIFDKFMKDHIEQFSKRNNPN